MRVTCWEFRRGSCIFRSNRGLHSRFSPRYLNEALHLALPSYVSHFDWCLLKVWISVLLQMNRSSQCSLAWMLLRSISLQKTHRACIKKCGYLFLSALKLLWINRRSSRPVNHWDSHVIQDTSTCEILYVKILHVLYSLAEFGTFITYLGLFSPHSTWVVPYVWEYVLRAENASALKGDIGTSSNITSVTSSLKWRRVFSYTLVNSRAYITFYANLAIANCLDLLALSRELALLVLYLISRASEAEKVNSHCLTFIYSISKNPSPSGTRHTTCK